jgi:myo-inositol-1(or 4)-monophosphatase
MVNMKIEGLTAKELKEVAEKVVTVSTAVGVKLLRRQRKLSDLKISTKEAQGVVSNADVEAENFLIKNLKPLIEEAEFLAEESAFKAYGSKKDSLKKYKEKKFVWIIDPLDGTTNYLNNMDYFGVCICLAYYGEPVLGIVHRPATNETYCAIKGKGAFLINTHGKKTRLKLVTNKKRLKDSLLVTGFACEKGEVFNKEFSIFKNMMKKSRGIRRMGSAALDFCLVSQGIFDSFWERGLSPWDVAAASLILEESGGVVTNYNGRAFHPFQETIVGSNESIHKQVLAVIKS